MASLTHVNKAVPFLEVYNMWDILKYISIGEIYIFVLKFFSRTPHEIPKYSLRHAGKPPPTSLPVFG